MNQLIFLFTSSFVVALSGAMMPGPLLTATIGETMKRGFVAGPLIIVGHALLEMSLLVAVVAGLGPWISRDITMGVLGVGGGILLVIMGVQMAATSAKAADRAMHAVADARSAVRGPVMVGILFSLSNPYWTLWWVTIGLNYAALALKSGLPGLASFYSGHILADLAWYSAIAAAVATGRRVCPRPVYIGLLVVCGAVLVGLGVYFFSAGIAKFSPG